MTIQFIPVVLLTLSVAFSEPAEVAEVRQFVNARSDAWAKWDFDTLAAQFAEDAERWDAKGDLIEGRKEIDIHCRETFKTEKSRQIQFTHKINRIRVITPNVAMVDASWTIKSTKEADTIGKAAAANSLENREVKSLLILRKREEKWEIVSLRANFMDTEKSKEF